MEFLTTSTGPTLSVSDVGKGEAGSYLLLHGLTSAKRYVLMGSKLLQKSGCRTVSYDARGHGTSTGALAPDEYRYESLVVDLLEVMSATSLDRPIGVGVSMGAHTLAAAAAADPNRFSGLLFITPAYTPTSKLTAEAEAHWRALADGLRSGGGEGFVAAGAVESVDPRWRDLAARATLQRMALHEHPDAVADALEVVPWSRPFDSWDQFKLLNCPVTVIGSRDAADPGHPLAVSEEWADSIPNARLALEDEGESPLAWRGSSISKLALELSD